MMEDLTELDDDLELYRVEVERLGKAQAFVLAHSEEEAESLLKRQFSWSDFESSEPFPVSAFCSLGPAGGGYAAGPHAEEYVYGDIPFDLTVGEWFEEKARRDRNKRETLEAAGQMSLFGPPKSPPGEPQFERDIFVFGSNREGRHGAGAAKRAVEAYGAAYGVAEGPQGNAYAIVTKELRPGYSPVSLGEISQGVRRFLVYAAEHRELRFLVSRIGGGLAGFDWGRQIRPLFDRAPDNVVLLERRLV